MNNVTVFDIIGPILVGPSSSHTAGAVRLGIMAGKILGCPVRSADVYLHGSFDKSGEGHGTRKAIAAGLLGLQPDDERVRDGLELAHSSGVAIAYHSWDGGDIHPNTAMFHLVGGDPERTCQMVGSSVGGGRIVVNRIDEFEVDFTGSYPTLIVQHKDSPGMVAAISSQLAQASINIAQMKLSREGKGKRALSIIETDQVPPESLFRQLEGLPDVERVIFIEPL